MAQIPNVIPPLTIIGYELARTCNTDTAPDDVFDWIEHAQAAAFNMPKAPTPIADLYSHLAATAAACLGALALLPPPDRIPGVRGYEELSE